MKFLKIFTSLLVLLCLLCGCTLPWEAPEMTLPAPLGDGLSVHFIDVGQADCALLECDG